MTRNEEYEKKMSAKLLLSKAKEAESLQKKIAIKVNERTIILVTEKKMKDQAAISRVIERMQEKYNYGKKKQSYK